MRLIKIVNAVAQVLPVANQALHLVVRVTVHVSHVVLTVGLFLVSAFWSMK